MYALIVYDSHYGNTQRVATAIAETLRASADARVVRIDPNQELDLAGVDLLILGSPTQGWRPTVAMQALLANLTPGLLQGRSIACFDTRFQKPRWLTGSAASVMANRVRRLGYRPLVPPESFFVEHTEGPLVTGELGRAAIWARAVLHQFAATQPVAQRERSWLA